MQAGFEYVDYMLMTQETNRQQATPTWIDLEKYYNCDHFSQDLVHSKSVTETSHHNFLDTVFTGKKEKSHHKHHHRKAIA